MLIRAECLDDVLTVRRRSWVSKGMNRTRSIMWNWLHRIFYALQERSSLWPLITAQHVAVASDDVIHLKLPGTCLGKEHSHE